MRSLLFSFYFFLFPRSYKWTGYYWIFVLLLWHWSWNDFFFGSEVFSRQDLKSFEILPFFYLIECSRHVNGLPDISYCNSQGTLPLVAYSRFLVYAKETLSRNIACMTSIFIYICNVFYIVVKSIIEFHYVVYTKNIFYNVCRKLK